MTDLLSSEWQRKGATLSDKTARKEFGLSQDQIVQAIRAGKLQYRYNSIHGNPFLRLPPSRGRIAGLAETWRGLLGHLDFQSRYYLIGIPTSLNLRTT